MRAGEELTGGDQARIGLGYEMTGDQRIGILEGTWRGKNGHQLWSWGGFEQQKSEMDGGGGGEEGSRNDKSGGCQKWWRDGD